MKIITQDSKLLIDAVYVSTIHENALASASSLRITFEDSVDSKSHIRMLLLLLANGSHNTFCICLLFFVLVKQYIVVTLEIIKVLEFVYF